MKIPLEKGSSVSIYKRYVHLLVTEMHKVSKGPSLPLASDISKQKDSQYYNLRLNCQFSRLLLELSFKEPKAFLSSSNYMGHTC